MSKSLPWLLVFAALGGFSVFFLLERLSAADPVSAQLQNYLHLPAYTLLFIGLRWILRREPSRRTDLILILVCLVFGAAIELVQPFFGRGASWRDLLLNIGGIVTGLIAWRVYSGILPRPWLLACAGILLAGLTQPLYWVWAQKERERAFPFLLDFDRSALAAFATVVDGAELRATPAPEGWRDQRTVGRLAVEPASWPGVFIRPVDNDWSGFEQIVFEVFSPVSEPQRLAVRIDDVHHSGGGDNFDRAFRLRPGLNQLRISLDDVRLAPADRELDMRNISQIFIYIRQPKAPVVLYLDDLRLTD